MTPKEKLRDILKDEEHAASDGTRRAAHLREEDLARLIENAPSAENLASLRRHLAECESCAENFKDFYAFFAPAEIGEQVADKAEIDRAWQEFAPRIADAETKSSFWSRIFPTAPQTNLLAFLSPALALLLLCFMGVAIYTAWQTKTENARLVEMLEKQKQTSEENLKSIEQSARDRNLTEREKLELQQEKDELQKRVAELQTKIEQAARVKEPARETVSAPPTAPKLSAEKPDNSLVAVNTPIYDVFPADAVVRGSRTENKLVVPNAAKNVVLILNAAGREDFPVYQAVLTNKTGKNVWRGGGLRKDSTGNFTLTIARTALKSGSYRLSLSSGGKTIAEYSINVESGK